MQCKGVTVRVICPSYNERYQILSRGMYIHKLVLSSRTLIPTFSISSALTCFRGMRELLITRPFNQLANMDVELSWTVNTPGPDDCSKCLYLFIFFYCKTMREFCPPTEIICNFAACSCQHSRLVLAFEYCWPKVEWRSLCGNTFWVYRWHCFFHFYPIFSFVIHHTSFTCCLSKYFQILEKSPCKRLLL